MSNSETGDFRNHLIMFVTFAVMFLGMFGWKFGFEHPPVQYLPYAFAAWGVGVLIHGFRVYRSAHDARSLR